MRTQRKKFLNRLFVLSIILCVSQSAFASSISNDKIVSLKREIENNLKELKTLRQSYYLYEDLIRPENILMWDGAEDYADKYNRETLIFDMTVDYYGQKWAGRERPDPNELANEIKLVLQFSNETKSYFQRIMDRIKKKIDLLENKTVSLQKELTRSFENMTSQSSVNNNTSTTSATRFASPVMGGLPLDWCLTFGSKCGKGAADVFCKNKGFSMSSSHDGPDMTPKKTYIIGNGKTCKADYCGSFYYIDCVK